MKTYTYKFERKISPRKGVIKTETIEVIATSEKQAKDRLKTIGIFNAILK